MEEPNVTYQPWTAFAGAKPCCADAPDALKARHGSLLVCTRPVGHEGAHAVGVDGTVSWTS